MRTPRAMTRFLALQVTLSPQESGPTTQRPGGGAGPGQVEQSLHLGDALVSKEEVLSSTPIIDASAETLKL